MIYYAMDKSLTREPPVSLIFRSIMWKALSLWLRNRMCDPMLSVSIFYIQLMVNIVCIGKKFIFIFLTLESDDNINHFSKFSPVNEMGIDQDLFLFLFLDITDKKTAAVYSDYERANHTDASQLVREEIVLNNKKQRLNEFSALNT